MSEFNPFSDKPQFDRELTPEGAHLARCARVIEIGVQGSELYGDKDKVVVVLSLPGVTMELNGEEKQKFISKPFGIPISTDDRSAMKQYARALCPAGGSQGNLGDFLDKPCQIVVRHKPKKDRIIEEIDSIAPIIPGTEVPALDTEPFWLKWKDPDVDVLKQVPPFTRNLIKQAVNYPGSYMEEAMLVVEEEQQDGDDFPF